MRAAIGRMTRNLADVRQGELAAVSWSAAYFFFLLASYYILRPIRDEMGVAGGVDNLAWLFTATLVGMLVLHPLYSALVGRLPRQRFVPVIYRFFLLHLVVFFLLLRTADAAQRVWVSRAFFVWVSVFNLFVVSVFWSFMTDLYRPRQSQRLFGLVAVGGTLGGIAGSAIASTLASSLGTLNLLLVSAILLEIATQASQAVGRKQECLAEAADDEPTPTPEPRATTAVPRPARGIIDGELFEGIRHVFSSPYLLGLAGVLLLFSVTSTFLYFQQAALAKAAFAHDPAGRTRLFAMIDLLVNAATVVLQLLVTGRLLRWLGVGLGLAILPLLSFFGFGLLAAMPALALVVVLQVLRRAGNYAIQRPAREVAYTVLPRTDKYKAKNFNDTFVYRVGDQVGAWSYTALGTLGLGASGLALTMLPVSLLGVLLALWLGRRYVAYQRAEGRDPVPAEAAPAVGGDILRV